MTRHRTEILDPKVMSRISNLSLAARTAVEGYFSGMHKSPHKGSSVEFAQYREYVKGDDTRRVDWRLWARTDRLYVKEFEADTNMRCHFIVDGSRSMAFGTPSSKFDFARKAAAALSYLASMQGDAPGIFILSEGLDIEIPPRHHPSHLRFILDALGRAEPSGGSCLAKNLHAVAEKIAKRSLVVFFSDLFEDPQTIGEAFSHFKFKKHDLAVFHLMDPQEMDFPFDRPTAFIDMETSTKIVAEPSAIRAQYMESLGRHMDAMKSEAKKADVDYNLVVTGPAFEEVIGSFLVRRQTLAKR